MAKSNVGQSPLEAAAGAAGPQTVAAFKLLSDETRVAILLALWEAYDPHAPDASVPFSTLYDRVSVRDSGTFSYHLDKLVGKFVEATEDGYRLRNSGLKLVRAVIAGAGLQDPVVEPTEIPRRCFFCGSRVELSYENERLYHICTGCDGHVGPNSLEQAPPGTVTVYDNFNPAGLTNRTPEEVFVAGTIEYHLTVRLLTRGVCPECSGPVDEQLSICDDHHAPPGELCASCGTWNEARVTYVCAECKYSGSYPAWAAVFDHPAIIAFYHDHGFDMTYDLEDAEACAAVWAKLKRDQTLVSTDPIRIRVTVPYEDDTLVLLLDEELDVIEISES